MPAGPMAMTTRLVAVPIAPATVARPIPAEPMSGVPTKTMIPVAVRQSIEQHQRMPGSAQRRMAGARFRHGGSRVHHGRNSDQRARDRHSRKDFSYTDQRCRSIHENTPFIATTARQVQCIYKPHQKLTDILCAVLTVRKKSARVLPGSQQREGNAHNSTRVRRDTTTPR